MTKNDILAARVLKRYLTRFPVLRACRHSELSIIYSADDDVTANRFLTEVALVAVQDAINSDMKDLQADNSHLPDSAYFDVFPGEHYRFLRSLVKTFVPKNIIEIGTFTGMSSAAMLRGMPKDSTLVTFDVVSWQEHNSHLDEDDFSSGRIRQILADLSSPSVFGSHSDLFSNCQLIFCDAPKDGIFEGKFLRNLAAVKPRRPAILVLEDTRLLNMADVWRSIQSPKLDLTSFGHWAGTGLVDISDGLRLK